MANAASTFLQGVNAGAAAAPQAPDERSVLAAIDALDVSTISSLANQLGTNQQAVAPVVNELVRSKLVQSGDGGALNLSANGELALRLAGMAKG